jgi:hypothetical protein
MGVPRSSSTLVFSSCTPKNKHKEREHVRVSFNDIEAKKKQLGCKKKNKDLILFLSRLDRLLIGQELFFHEHKVLDSVQSE